MKKVIIFLAMVSIGISAFSQGNKIVKYARYEHDGIIGYGLVEDNMIIPVTGDIFSEYEPTDNKIPIQKVKLLPPTSPKKVIAMAFNYLSHTVNTPVPEKPIAFAKLPTCIIGPEEAIVRPSDSKNLHYEGELVVVFKRRTKNIAAHEVADHILGVTIGNDVSERDWQKEEPRWLRAKASDTFGPMGPWIVSGLDYNDLLLETRLNGEIVQSQRTSDMFFNVEESVSYFSKYITFEPGDVLFLGTPGVTKPMEPGDKVEISIEGIGTLSNTLVSE